MLIPGSMTFHTILEIPDSLFQMLGLHLSFIVFMTTITGIGGKSCRMTSDTGGSTTMI
jgi:hypothetical protein